VSASPEVDQDPRFVAAVGLLPRVGVADFEIRYSEPESFKDDSSGSPVVWIAIVHLRAEIVGENVPPQVAAALTPYRALYRLLEQLVDGAKCAHCKRPTAISDELGREFNLDVLCWYVYDPELQTYRRSCEGGRS
jgi:hypothetical protein